MRRTDEAAALGDGLDRFTATAQQAAGGGEPEVEQKGVGAGAMGAAELFLKIPRTHPGEPSPGRHIQFDMEVLGHAEHRRSEATAQRAQPIICWVGQIGEQPQQEPGGTQPSCRTTVRRERNASHCRLPAQFVYRPGCDPAHARDPRRQLGILNRGMAPVEFERAATTVAMESSAGDQIQPIGGER